MGKDVFDLRYKRFTLLVRVTVDVRFRRRNCYLPDTSHGSGRWRGHHHLRQRYESNTFCFFACQVDRTRCVALLTYTFQRRLGHSLIGTQLTSFWDIIFRRRRTLPFEEKRFSYAYVKEAKYYVNSVTAWRNFHGSKINSKFSIFLETAVFEH